MLAVVIDNLTGLEFLRQQALPLAGVIVLLIIGVMVWQYRTEQRLALPARPVWDSDRPPFPGLEAFTEQDAAVFFGRDAEIVELLDRLHPVVARQANRLVTLVGPSGAGKSSLVQAGVVPRLRQRRGGWIVIPPVVPGDHPLKSLTRSLSTACPGHAVDDVLAPRFLDELRAAHRGPNASVLVIVDQAEELITLSGKAECDDFLDRVASALDADLQLWIIMIMRTEFLNAFLGTEHARLFRDPIGVGTLSPAALVEVIEEPARRAGLTFDPPSLPQRMAADAGGGDALPLLAYALQELCLTAGSDGVLTADVYERIDGVTGVLTRQANKVAAELERTDGPVLATLLKFVTIGENEPTRRRVWRSALTDAQWRVADSFIAARLLSSTPVGNDTVLEVAHEALFRSWAPLRQAIEACTEQLRWRADLERWAKDWDNSGRQDAYLLRDERLKTAQHWATSDGEVMDGLPLVAEFLSCSNRADFATMERLSETIARQALATADSDPGYSLLLALAAFEECAPTALALRALVTVLVVSQVRAVLKGHDDTVTGVTWSPDGQRLATASADRTIRIWNAVNGAELAVLHGHDDWVRGVAWSPDGERLATASMDWTARIWNVDNGSEFAVLRGHDGSIQDVAWSPNGRRLATASDDRTIRIWDANNGGQPAVLHCHNEKVRAVAWSPDGGRLAAVLYDQTIWIRSVDATDEPVVLRGHDHWVRAVAWSPDGRRLATASRDRTARIWDAASGKQQVVLDGHEDDVRGMAWSPDGRRLVTGSNDRTVRIWNAESGAEIITAGVHNGGVEGVAWSPDGRRVASASRDGTSRVWNAMISTEQLVANARRRISRELTTEERRNLMLPQGRQTPDANSTQTAHSGRASY